jgi:hypothetical protein
MDGFFFFEKLVGGVVGEATPRQHSTRSHRPTAGQTNPPRREGWPSWRGPLIRHVFALVFRRRDRRSAVSRECEKEEGGAALAGEPSQEEHEGLASTAEGNRSDDSDNPI